MKLLIVCFFLLGGILQGQDKNDIEYLFKLQLFLDAKNRYYPQDKDIIKTNLLFDNFYQSVETKIDTLNARSDLFDFMDSFQYYRVNVHNITYKDGENIPVPTIKCNIYIIALNNKTGLVYRLKGFNGNDFNDYLKEVKKMYSSWDMNISYRQILRRYKVEDLDFHCLYKNILSQNQNDNCMIKCSDPIMIR